MNPLMLFGGASLLTKVIVVFGVVAMVGTAYGVWHYKVYSRGYDAAIADIGRQDKRAVEAATRARGAVRDCRERGLEWDQTTGRCSQ